jgi:adenylate cyclase
MVKDSRKIAAILAADVVNYSRLMGADEAGTLAALKACRAIFGELAIEFDGREFGSVGDSLMAEFPSAVNAVSCALAIQERMDEENAALPSTRRMQLRIGVNLGDVIQEGGLAFGDTVNVAARLQALAKPGGVLISGPVYDQVHRKIPAQFIAAGIRQVKNIVEPVRTFEMLPAKAPGTAGRIAGILVRVSTWRVRRMAAVITALVFAVLLGLLSRELLAPSTSSHLGSLLGQSNAGAGPNSIAVLPFVNMSGDSRNDYLGEGLAEELTNRLTKIADLRVAARTSAFAFKGKELAVGEIADRLGVRYVVEGSVRRQADIVRVTAALVEAASGSSSWSNTFDSSSADLLKLESDLAGQVVKALELVLGKRTETVGPQADAGIGISYDYYLQGLAYLRQPASAKTLGIAEELFQRALSAHPDFARAQAGLCETRMERYILERVPAIVAAAEEACANAEALDNGAQEVHLAVGGLRLATGDAAEAETAYRRALALVPQSSDALIGLAESLAAGGKMEESETMHKRAIAAQTSYAAAHLSYGNFLFSQGRAAEAVPVYERATLLTPDNPNAFSNLGGAYLLMGNFKRAEEAFARSLALEPRRASYSNTGTVKYYLGHYAEAGEMFRKAIAFTPSDQRLWGNLADAQLFDSQADEARKSYQKALDLVDGELAVNPRHAVNQAQAAYYATRLDDPKRARRNIQIALSEGAGDVYVEYYVALAELGLGDMSAAVAHARRARELGYPEILMRAAPELGEIRNQL